MEKITFYSGVYCQSISLSIQLLYKNIGNYVSGRFGKIKIMLYKCNVQVLWNFIVCLLQICQVVSG